MPLPPTDWRIIHGFPNYSASPEGEVARNLVDGKHRILKAMPTRDGYFVVDLYRSKGDARKRRRRYVHEVIAATFLGARPMGAQICHNNGNRKDNRLDNLRYDTPAANGHDRVMMGTPRRGEENVAAKLNPACVYAMREERRQGHKYRDIGNRYGVSDRAASFAIRGITWGWLK